MPIRIKLRTDEIVKFVPQKIETAISLAMREIGNNDLSLPKALTKKIVDILEDRFGKTIPTVEEVQDVVENTLIKAGYADSAKAYILYREKRAQSRVTKDVIVNVNNTISEYLNKLDWRVNANSNQGYSLGGMILNSSGKITANYWLSYIYPKAVGEAHRNADMHIHDLDIFSGYCAGWSLRALLEEGFNGISDKIESSPPKHLSTAVSQMVNFLGTLQNEWAGAQAFSSFDTYLAPFVKKYALELEKEIDSEDIYNFKDSEQRQDFINKKIYKYVLQNIQSFVFNLNVPSRWGTQTPFSNITLDWVCPEDLKSKRLKLGGKYFDFTFGELQKEMDMINSAYIEVMTRGDAKGRVFTFPIPTYNITKDFNWNNKKTDALFEMTAKYGVPYFQNFINSDLSPHHVRSMCCRLQLDLKELLKRGNGLFGSAEMTGSLGVVTISAARIGYLFKGDKEAFYKRLGYVMDLAKTSLEIKRKEIKKWLDRGLFPYTKRYLGHFNNHFSTIGINGINEAIRNFSDDKYDITTQEGHKFAEEVLLFMRERLAQFQEETGNLYNLEATPAEGTTYRLAKEDRSRFPDIICAGTDEAPYYTNSSQLPVEYSKDPFEALTKQDELQTKYTGGTVLHLYLSERVPNVQMCKDLLKKALTNFRLPYVTITPTFSICPKHGHLVGEHDFCPRCDEEIGYQGIKEDIETRLKFDSKRKKENAKEQLEEANSELFKKRTKCEIWTRVMGYYRPVSHFNIGKKSEHYSRNHFKAEYAYDPQ
jgi:ribonucleoside-triphosphate reductase (formate)